MLLTPAITWHTGHTACPSLAIHVQPLTPIFARSHTTGLISSQSSARYPVFLEGSVTVPFILIHQKTKYFVW